ncbi:MAG TPA: glycosyltransferase family 9 protein [Alphaproteobacteria bacterium]|jgi:ADP-heptose:LPS heptosyltransferase
MRILFVTSTRIGDAVLSTGLLDRLIRAHPGAAVTIACGPPAAPLFEAVPGLERVLVMEKRPFARHWLALWRQAAATRWEVIVDLRGSPVTALLRHGRRHAWRPRRTDEHRVVQLSRLLGLDSPAMPRLWTAPRHEDEARRRMPPGGPVLALGPTANWPGKEWPADRFAALAERLTAPDGPLAGARIAVLGGPGERATARPLLDALAPDRAIDLIGTELLVTFACLGRAALYVGNDSGLMHLAAASGAPTLGLFGPTRDVHYAPFGPRCAVVRTPESAEALLPPGSDVNTTGNLMGGLTVAAVEAAARGLLARAGAAA